MSKKVKAWIEAMRLRTLPVSCAGVLAGTACALATGGFKLLPALICLVFAIVAQIASNFANEYYDFKGGLDKKGREGFRRGVTEGDLSAAAMKCATYLLLILDSLLGCSLIYWGGWWLIAVGIAVALFAVGYSTGPYPLSHHGLGDVAVVIFFGIVPVMFTDYLQCGSWQHWQVSLPVSIAVGLLGANVLIVNNYRDYEDDKAVNKHTTVVIFGRRAMSTVYLIDGIAAYALMCVGFRQLFSAWWLVAVGLFLLLHIALYRKITGKRGAALNPMLGLTAMLLLASAVTMLVAAATC